jgi:uncharacterized membrane protein
MKLYRSIQRQGLTMPVLALAVASSVCVSLVAYRIMIGTQPRHAYLVWNLFLAWLPLVFAALAAERHGTSGTVNDRRLLALGAAWLAFFPNAPYIFTDLVHVLGAWRHGFWTELMLFCSAPSQDSSPAFFRCN